LIAPNQTPEQVKTKFIEAFKAQTDPKKDEIKKQFDAFHKPTAAPKPPM